MTPTTAEIAEAVQDYVADLYGQLFDAAPLLIAGLIVFAAGMAVLAYALAKKLRPMDRGVRLVVRILMGLSLVVACVFACLDVANHGGIVGIAVLILASVAAIFGLIKGARWAKYVIVGIIWLYLAPFEITCLAGAIADRANIETFAPISQLGVFAADNYVVYHAVAAALLAIVLSFAVLLLLRDSRQTNHTSEAAELPFEIEPDKIVYIIVAVVLIIFAIPGFLYGDLAGYLTDGTSGISNAFVERLNEYLDDPSVNEDAVWMSPFTAASDELYEADARFLDINPAAMRRSDILLYILYSEASFRQMEAIETIHTNVAAGEPVDSEALAVFNASIEDQQDALITQLNSVANFDYFDEAPRIAYDSAFYYLRMIGLVPCGWGLIVLGILCGVAGVLVLRHKPRVPVAPVADEAPAAEDAPIENAVHAGPAAEAGKQFELKPAVRIALIAGIVIAAIGYFVFTEVIPTIEDTKEQENSAAFIDEVQATIATRPAELVLWLREAQKADASDLTQEYLQTGIDLIDAQLAGLDTLDTWEELPEDAGDFGTLFAQLSERERPILNEMRSALASGEIPPQELLSEYAKLRSGETAEQLEECLETFLVQYSIGNVLDLALDD